jgi:PPOX class probable F420-dependent enzyme
MDDTQARRIGRPDANEDRERRNDVFDTASEAGRRVEGRLREEGIAWPATVRADGQPQSVPVWFLWGGGSFLIYSQPNPQKLRNIERNPRVGLNLNSNTRGGDVARVEGVAEIVREVPPATEVPEYVNKYRESIARIDLDEEGLARAYSVAVRVTPERWQVW